MRTWHQAFRAWVESVGGRLDASLRLKVHTNQIHYWLHGAYPREPMRSRIQRASKGAVAASLPRAVMAESDAADASCTQPGADVQVGT